MLKKYLVLIFAHAKIIYGAVHFWDWIISILSTITLAIAYLTLRLTRQQNMPRFRLVENPNMAPQFEERYNFKVNMNNSSFLVARITSYGYKTFLRTKVIITQVNDQNALLKSTDWGQKLIFENEPNQKDIYYFYIYDSVTNKNYYFYPNGKWFSRFKYLLTLFI